MRPGPVNTFSLKWSLALHGVLLAAVAFVPWVPGCRQKELIIPLDFTVVLDEHLAAPDVPESPEPITPDPPPPTPPPPDPSPPKPLPPLPPDAVPIEPKKPDPPPKKPEVKKPPEPPKPPPKKPEPPPPKPTFVRGTRVEAPKPKQPDFDKIYKPVTDPKLSRKEIEDALRGGAKPGIRNSIPEDELSRCVVLVRRALFDAWVQPGRSDAGPRPALLDIRLDSSGRIVSYDIRQSSGSAFFDQTVRKAAANAQPIRGLTLAFLKQYETLTVEFKLEQ